MSNGFYWDNPACQTLKIIKMPDVRAFTLFSGAAKQIPSKDTDVYYDNTLIASLNYEQTTVVPCEGQKMASNIVINAPKNVEQPIEISSVTEMNALLTEKHLGGVYKYVGETTESFEKNAIYIVERMPHQLTITAQQEQGWKGVDNTYIKLHSRPTSENDYDYDAQTLLNNEGTISTEAAVYYIWDTSWNETYDKAYEQIVTADTNITIIYYYA